jgi:glycosyltransferase involved in cell wall biosynthesis
MMTASPPAMRPAAAGDASSLPRVLFVTPAAFNQVTGGGITFGNLFRGWPRDRLATVHNDRVPVSHDVCSTYYELTGAELALPAVLRRLRPRPPAPGGAVTPGGSAGSYNLLRRAKYVVFGDGLPERGHLSAALESWIEAFRPELLYTILGNNAMMELIDRIRRRFALPLVVHFMDDWQSAIYRGGLLSAIERRRMRRLIGTLVGAASVRLGIGDSMCQEYQHRFGQPFLAFQNTVDVARWRAVAKRDLAVGQPLRLLYTGSVLGFAQAESLVACCAAVAALRREGMAIELDIYSPPEQTGPLRARLACDEAIRLHDVIADDAVYFRTLAAADILLLPVNFDAHSVRYIRLSMPTKVPSYLVSGTPVLVYGPAGVAQVEYARAAGWGHVVDVPDPALLRAAIKHLAGDRNLREALSQTARRIAAERHDDATVRAAFRAALSSAVGRAA